VFAIYSDHFTISVSHAMVTLRSLSSDPIVGDPLGPERGRTPGPTERGALPTVGTCSSLETPSADEKPPSLNEENPLSPPLSPSLRMALPVSEGSAGHQCENGCITAPRPTPTPGPCVSRSICGNPDSGRQPLFPPPSLVRK